MQLDKQLSAVVATLNATPGIDDIAARLGGRITAADKSPFYPRRPRPAAKLLLDEEGNEQRIVLIEGPVASYMVRTLNGSDPAVPTGTRWVRVGGLALRVRTMRAVEGRSPVCASEILLRWIAGSGWTRQSYKLRLTSERLEGLGELLANLLQALGRWETEGTGYPLKNQSWCIVCGRPLIDPMSVHIGIGPDCREQFGNLFGFGPDSGVDPINPAPSV